MAKIFEIAEGAKASGQPVDPHELSGWVQRAICMACNVNSSLAIERRKAIIFKINPRMSNLAVTEAGAGADGLLFGKSFATSAGANHASFMPQPAY